uniref:Uncharacterized protein n=1 Tax=Siphoviridae sp. ct7dP4 TaxID=2827787 RepID=A0A8S5TNM7_9CAUD|nr:MAG TPA: hypothetical protein [Siphoviridae sp. ct7dP4]DAX45166.1 MAG TPA: hypothetical protein [Caudoviricetes sp.]
MARKSIIRHTPSQFGRAFFRYNRHFKDCLL